MALTVLIVEDEQSASRLLSGIASEVGLSARATGSAKEAQELCSHAAASGQPFSAVVLDLVLSELDGFQFADAARAAAPNWKPSSSDSTRSRITAENG